MAQTIDLLKNSSFEDKLDALIEAIIGNAPISPTISISKRDGVATITIIDAQGSRSVEISDGLGNGDVRKEDFATINPSGGYMDAAINALQLGGKAASMYVTKDAIPTPEIMKGASASGDGESGLVPVPLQGANAKFLRGDASWQSISASDIGLGNVGNYKAVSTVASQTLSSDEQTNARDNIGLGNASIKSVTDSSSASAIGTGTNVPTERDIYYGLPTINGEHAYTSASNYYAPEAVGTSGQILVSQGAGKAPTWANPGAASGSTMLSATLTAGGTSVAISDSIIKADDTCAYEIFTNKYGVSPSDVAIANGSITLTFSTQSENLAIKVRVTSVG